MEQHKEIDRNAQFKCVFGVLVLAGISLSATAQSKADKSKLSVFGGYSFLHYDNGTDQSLYGPGEPDSTANANGFVASAAYNVTHMVAIVGEYGFYHANSVSNTGAPSGISSTANMQTYLFGPKVSFHAGRITPFAQVLFGGAHANIKESEDQSGYTLSFTSPSANSFAWAGGGGVDWKVSRHISIRPAQFEYVMTRFSNANTVNDSNNFGVPRPGDGGNGTQNNYRYSAGLVFNF